MDTELLDLASWLRSLVDFLPNVIAAIVLFILTLVLAGLVRRWVRKMLEERNTIPQISALLSKVAYWGTIILGLITSLQQVGFNLTAFLTGVGVVGFTVGFALQDVSKNFIAGILLLIQEPFEIGEQVEVASFTGTVRTIDLRATEIKTLDGKIVLIPNTDVLTQPITNYSRADSRRIHIQVGVAYGSDLATVRRTALEAITQLDELLHDPPPEILLNNFGPSTLDVSIYYWIDTKVVSVLKAIDHGITVINEAFGKAGIDMPYPTQRLMIAN